MNKQKALYSIPAPPPPIPIPKSSPKPSAYASAPNTNSVFSPKPIRPKASAASVLSSAAKGSIPRS